MEGCFFKCNFVVKSTITTRMFRKILNKGLFRSIPRKTTFKHSFLLKIIIL